MSYCVELICEEMCWINKLSLSFLMKTSNLMNFFPKNMFCHVFHSLSFCFHVIMNASLIMPFLLLFPSICVTPNHPERFKEKTAERKKRRVAKFGWNHSVEGFWTEGLNTFLCAITLYVCVSACVLNAHSWKEIMSAIYTWACFLLWISFTTQDKTPGKTQTPLCLFHLIWSTHTD